MRWFSSHALLAALILALVLGLAFFPVRAARSAASPSSVSSPRRVRSLDLLWAATGGAHSPAPQQKSAGGLRRSSVRVLFHGEVASCSRPAKKLNHAEQH